MGIEAFIPQKWAANFLTRLRKSLVAGQIVNRQYEGEIRESGDTVHILEIGPVAASAYTKGNTLTYSDLDGTDQSMLVDQATEFHFKIDDVDRAQTVPGVMQEAMGEAAYAVADTIDQFILGKYASAGATGTSSTIGVSGTSLSVSSGNVIETVSYMGRYLDENNVPSQGRWFIVPPWFHQKLLLAEVGGISATAVPKVNSDTELRNGFVGQAMGFDIFVSNNVSNNGTQYRPMAGNRSALAYVGQLTQMEAFRLQTTFASAARGLYVYGAKVVRPNALCTAYVAEAAG